MGTNAVVSLVVCVGIAAVQGTDGNAARDIAALQATVGKLERQVDALNTLVQALIDSRADAALTKTLVGTMAPASAGAAARGLESAPVTVLEVADYHCPFCRQVARNIVPRLTSEYIETGKVRYIFLDYPIGDLHPNSLSSHQAARCAGESGKYWDITIYYFSDLQSQTLRRLRIWRVQSV